MSDSGTEPTQNVRIQAQLPETSGLKPIIPRQSFSKEEEELILKYIVYYEHYDRLRVMNMWKELSRYFNNGRTAEALRERFRRFIIPQIYKYSISNEEKNQITVGFAKNVQTRKGRYD